MGKDKTVAAAPVATTEKDSEDKVMDEIRSKNIMPTDLAKEVQDEIDADDKSKKKSQMKAAIQNATYYNFAARLNLRKRRKEAAVTKDELEQTAVLLSKLTGVTWDGKEVKIEDRITMEQYKVLRRTMKDDIRKKMGDLESTYAKEVNELDNTDCARYSHDWCL